VTSDKRKKYLREIIFGVDTLPGRIYDIGLMLIIAMSVTAVMFDSVASVNESHGGMLYGVEWFFTVLFTVDYAIRIYCAERKGTYVFSFFGVIDLLSVMPTYLGAFIPGIQFLTTIRFLRVLRMFRVLKLAAYLKESKILMQMLRATARRILVFLFFIMALVVVLGSLMYTIEASEASEDGFTNIPRSIYWAVVTLTTVGYGDISPQTGLGQTIAALIMILGYSIIVVPMGIVAYSMPRVSSQDKRERKCPGCPETDHDSDAKYCKACGKEL
jgi:voltage-gated potassium channel